MPSGSARIPVARSVFSPDWRAFLVSHQAAAGANVATLFGVAARIAAGGASLATGLARLFAAPLMRRALHVRGASALAGDLALFLGSIEAKPRPRPFRSCAMLESSSVSLLWVSNPRRPAIQMTGANLHVHYFRRTRNLTRSRWGRYTAAGAPKVIAPQRETHCRKSGIRATSGRRPG